MLDRLIDLVVAFAHLFRFWCVIQPNEYGIITRLGRRGKDLPPGLHFYIPFSIDQVQYTETVPFTEMLGAQTLHPQGADATAVTITPVVTWLVVDPYKYMFEVAEGSDAILDLVAGAVGEAVQRGSSEDLFDGTVCEEVATLASERAAEYGVEIIRIQFADAAECGAYRLIGGLQG